jgi:hypothetical protein
MNKNLKYGLIFGGVVVGSYIIVKIVQKISNAVKGAGDGDEAEKVLEEVATTGTTTNTTQSKYAKLFSLAKNNSTAKANIEAIQKLHNEAVALKKQGSKIAVDGWFGNNTYNALNKAPFGIQNVRLDDVVSNPTASNVKALLDWMQYSLNNMKKTASSNTNTSSGITDWTLPQKDKGLGLDWLIKK